MSRDLTAEWLDELEAQVLKRAEHQSEVSNDEIRNVFAFARRALRERDSLGVLKAFVPLTRAGLVDAHSADSLFRIR